MVKPLTIKEDFPKIIELIENGCSVKKACRELKTSDATFWEYIEQSPSIKSQYTKARENRGDICLDKIEQYEQELREGIIDAQTARVLIDTEKWKACKFYPKMYGDKQEIEQKVTLTQALVSFVEEKDASSSENTKEVSTSLN